MITDKLDWPAGYKADIAAQLSQASDAPRKRMRELGSRVVSYLNSSGPVPVRVKVAAVQAAEVLAWRDAISKVIAFLESETRRFRQVKLNVAEGLSTLVTDGQPTDPVCLERWIRNNDREVAQCYTVLGLINRGWSMEQIRNTSSQSDIGRSLADGETAEQFLQYMT